MLELLEFLRERGIPFYGVDVVSRNRSRIFTGDLSRLREEQIVEEKEIYSKENPFPLRDEYMSNAMAEICAAEPNRHIVGLFHNLHIKKKGSS